MSMLRVSSRQRLVSWDAFDASYIAPCEELEAFFLDPLDDGATTLDATTTPQGHDMEEEDAVVVLKRKRMNREMEGGIRPSLSTSSLTLRGSTSSHTLYYDCPPSSHAIPYYESMDSSEKEDLQLIHLPTEVQLHVLQFLEPSDLRTLTHVCQAERALLTTNDAAETAIWKPLCEQMWPFLQGRAAWSPPTSLSSHRPLEYAMLLALAVTNVPSAIDTSLFSPVYQARLRRSRSLRSYRTPTSIPPYPHKLVLVDTMASSDARIIQAVQFRGTVGLGDRCIRSDAPLPRPLRWTPATTHRRSSWGSPRRLLCRRADVLRQNAALYRPFCAPFCSRHRGTLQWTPRYMSYFEVSILPSTEERAPPPRGGLASDCVAVGLATEGFSLFHRMPGWDADSYGYHGDDGGLFHGAGSMISEYGPRFGVGDTIGCGVDGIRQAIFFTLNGVFLGYAMELSPKHVDVDLYPVVGMDSQYPVWCNFGTQEPFRFDLEEFMEPHEAIVRHHLWF